MRYGRITTLIASTLLLLATAACGSDDDGDASESEGSNSGQFPVTVETEFGDVTIEEQPERVVALGWGDAETALALGVQPVGASDWLEFGGDGVGPWLDGAYDESPTIIGTLEPELEKIAGLEPDLILDVNSSGEQKRYDALSKIAPVVGVPPGATSYSVGWREQLKTIATALGEQDKSGELIESVNKEFAAQSKKHPEFKGKSIAIGARTADGWGAYVDTDQRVQFAESLGFTNSKAIQQKADGEFSIDVSAERLDLLDADLTVVFPIYVDEQKITGDPLFQKIPSVEDGRVVVFDDGPVRTAFSTGTAPALLYALKHVPQEFSNALQ